MAHMKFWERIDRTPTCWLWTGPKDRYGYGISHAKGVRGAHRLSWLLHRGPLPDGLQIDHLCRVRNCVNPDHLELVTPYENWRRGEGPTAQHARQTHCINGHPFDKANTYRTRSGHRNCRACNRLSVAAYNARRQGAA